MGRAVELARMITAAAAAAGQVANVLVRAGHPSVPSSRRRQKPPAWRRRPASGHTTGSWGNGRSRSQAPLPEIAVAVDDRNQQGADGRPAARRGMGFDRVDLAGNAMPPAPECSRSPTPLAGGGLRAEVLAHQAKVMSARPRRRRQGTMMRTGRSGNPGPRRKATGAGPRRSNSPSKSPWRSADEVEAERRQAFAKIRQRRAVLVQSARFSR